MIRNMDLKKATKWRIKSPVFTMPVLHWLKLVRLLRFCHGNSSSMRTTLATAMQVGNRQ